MSLGCSPASSTAARMACVPSARVVIPEPRVYSVSPTPTMAYLPRRCRPDVASKSVTAHSPKRDTISWDGLAKQGTGLQSVGKRRRLGHTGAYEPFRSPASAARHRCLRCVDSSVHSRLRSHAAARCGGSRRGQARKGARSRCRDGRIGRGDSGKVGCRHG